MARTPSSGIIPGEDRHSLVCSSHPFMVQIHELFNLSKNKDTGTWGSNCEKLSFSRQQFLDKKCIVIKRRLFMFCDPGFIKFEQFTFSAKVNNCWARLNVCILWQIFGQLYSMYYFSLPWIATCFLLDFILIPVFYD